MKIPPRQRETGRRDAKTSSRPVSASLARRRRAGKPPADAGAEKKRPPADAGGADKVITLLTDFGVADYFVGAVKGVILAANPNARIIDITHEIAPHDIEAAAFTLLAAHESFPAGTIHVAVVDPGVGSARRPLLIRASEQFFVGPDNGIFSYVCDRSEQAEIVHLTNSKYFRHPVSPTFNGRDIFAPVAAALSTGVTPADLGDKVKDYVKLKPLQAEAASNGEIVGRIIHVDRFGNCVTNITPAELTPRMIAGGARLRVKGKVVKSFRNYFAEVTGSKDKVFAVWGSAGFLEIAAAQRSAAQILKVSRGDEVIASQP